MNKWINDSVEQLVRNYLYLWKRKMQMFTPKDQTNDVQPTLTMVDNQVNEPQIHLAQV